MPVKVYTLEDANRLLPTVETAVRLMQTAVRQAHLARDRVAVLEVLGASDPQSPENEEWNDCRAELEEWKEAFQAEVERLAEHGVIVRDVKDGLVDFPAQRDGQLVFLCWRLGEASIRFWHEPGAGFAGRRPIEEGERFEGGADPDGPDGPDGPDVPGDGA